jgi:serine carboxypeptidase-like clade 1
LYKDLVAAKVKVLHYSGDTDLVVPFTENIAWLRKLVGEKTLSIKNDWHQYQVNEQVAGYVTEYNEGFTFVTIKGTGHSAPMWKRAESYHVFQSFLDGKPI